MYTQARNAMKKARAKLSKQCGPGVDVHEIIPRLHTGNAAAPTSPEALTRGYAVTLQAWRCVRGGADEFDAGDHEMVGELTVKL